jgi:hypothetical protein
MLPLTTRTPNGLTNAAPWQTMADAGIPDPTWAHLDVEDFNSYAAGNWSLTAVGTSAVSLPAAEGGQALLSTSNGIADALYVQRAVASFKLTAGKDTFFKFKGKLSDVSASVFHCGLIITAAAPLAAADGVYVVKATGQAGLSLVSKVGGVATTVAFPASCLLVNATDFEIGIHIDPAGNVFGYFNPTTGSNPRAAGSINGPCCKLAAPGVTQVLLNPSFGLLNSAAAIKTLSADYFVAATAR